jgi:hypothetical protein
MSAHRKIWVGGIGDEKSIGPVDRCTHVSLQFPASETPNSHRHARAGRKAPAVECAMGGYSAIRIAQQHRSSIRARFALLFALLDVYGCGLRGRRYSDIQTPTPLGREDTLIIGFMGGRDSWRDENVGVGRLAAKLRKSELNGVHVETVENLKRGLALKFVKNCLDHDGDGELDDSERRSARIILYGQSFGGAAVVKFARQLNEMAVPILLTIQIDSVGRGDEMIPPNVKTAANFYQNNGRVIHGAKNIHATETESHRYSLQPSNRLSKQRHSDAQTSLVQEGVPHRPLKNGQ